MKTCKECNVVEIPKSKKCCSTCAYKRKLAGMKRCNERLNQRTHEHGQVRKHEYFTPERIKKLAEDGSYMSRENGGYCE